MRLFYKTILISLKNICYISRTLIRLVEGERERERLGEYIDHRLIQSD